jgi:hypothetical protein
MNKKIGMKKCEPIIGEVKNINNEYVEKYKEDKERLVESKQNTVKEFMFNIEDYILKSKMNRFVINLEKEKERINKKIKKAEEKEKLWKEKDPSFSFVFEDILKIKGENND